LSLYFNYIHLKKSKGRQNSSIDINNKVKMV